MTTAEKDQIYVLLEDIKKKATHLQQHIHESESAYGDDMIIELRSTIQKLAANIDHEL